MVHLWPERSRQEVTRTAQSPARRSHPHGAVSHPYRAVSSSWGVGHDVMMQERYAQLEAGCTQGVVFGLSICPSTLLVTCVQSLQPTCFAIMHILSCLHVTCDHAYASNSNWSWLSLCIVCLTSSLTLITSWHALDCLPDYHVITQSSVLYLSPLDSVSSAVQFRNCSPFCFVFLLFCFILSFDFVLNSWILMHIYITNRENRAVFTCLFYTPIYSILPCLSFYYLTPYALSYHYYYLDPFLLFPCMHWCSSKQSCSPFNMSLAKSRH